MVTAAENVLQQLADECGKQVSTHLFGQEMNSETYANCRPDLRGSGSVTLVFLKLMDDMYYERTNRSLNLIQSPAVLGRNSHPTSVWACRSDDWIWL